MAHKSSLSGVSNPQPPQASAPHPAIADAMPWVVRWLAGLEAGSTILDLACGQGRHSLLAAEAGHQVLAVDKNDQALKTLAAKNSRIETLVCDLEAAPWPFSQRRFDAIVVTNYLFRERLSLLPGLLAPGGRLIYATFGLGNEQYGRPSNPDFLLAPGELIRLAQRSGLIIAGFESGVSTTPKPAVVERLCAWRPDASKSPVGIDPIR
ncbi:MAG: class I SAM-dependent methyltransferase [Burkholderiaceae bacterium]